MERDICLDYASLVLEKSEKADFPSTLPSFARRIRVNKFLRRAHERTGEVINIEDSRRKDLKNLAIGVGIALATITAVAKGVDMTLKIMSDEAREYHSSPY